MLSEAPVDLCIINIPPLSDRTLTSQIRGSQIVTFKLSSPLLQMQRTSSPFLTSAVPEKEPSRSRNVCVCVCVCDWPSVSLIKEPLPKTLSDCSVFSVTFLWTSRKRNCFLSKALLAHQRSPAPHTLPLLHLSLSFTASYPLSLCLTTDGHQDEQCNSRWKVLCERVECFLEQYVD